MATTLWSTFYPYIQPHLPGCPEIVMEASMQEAAAKFLERSEVWRFEIETDFAVKNVADYPIFIPTKEAVLENIYELVLDGQPMSRVSDKHIDSTRFRSNGRPAYYTIFQDTSIRLYPTPDKKYSYSGWGVLKTKLSATGVEDWVFESHGRCISYGALAQLSSIPGKEWTNLDLSMYYRQKFAKEIDNANSREYRGVSSRIQFRDFAGGRRRG